MVDNLQPINYLGQRQSYQQRSARRKTPRQNVTASTSEERGEELTRLMDLSDRATIPAIFEFLARELEMLGFLQRSANIGAQLETFFEDAHEEMAIVVNRPGKVSELFPTGLPRNLIAKLESLAGVLGGGIRDEIIKVNEFQFLGKLSALASDPSAGEETEALLVLQRSRLEIRCYRERTEDEIAISHQNIENAQKKFEELFLTSDEIGDALSSMQQGLTQADSGSIAAGYHLSRDATMRMLFKE
ncbi:MAG: hypothetical protein NUW37_18550 [Planctomycetes bacterium]|nr:hypothetical protein [Planctomycetota bacterium]